MIFATLVWFSRVVECYNSGKSDKTRENFHTQQKPQTFSTGQLCKEGGVHFAHYALRIFDFARFEPTNRSSRGRVLRNRKPSSFIRRQSENHCFSTTITRAGDKWFIYLPPDRERVRSAQKCFLSIGQAPVRSAALIGQLFRIFGESLRVIGDLLSFWFGRFLTVFLIDIVTCNFQRQLSFLTWHQKFRHFSLSTDKNKSTLGEIEY